MEARTVDLTVNSLRNQDVTLIARHGIEKISAPAGVLVAHRPGMADCQLHLPEGTPVEIRLELGWGQPIDWVSRLTA